MNPFFSPLGGRLASGNINENLASDSLTCDLRGRGHYKYNSKVKGQMPATNNQSLTTGAFNI